MPKIFWLALFLAMSQPAFCGEAADLLNRGVEKFHKGDLDGAIADYSKAIELKPNDALGYYNRGVARNAKGDRDGAIADYDKAIELNPKHAEAYYNRGNAKRDKTNGLDSAVMDFSKAIQLKPSFPEAYNNRGRTRALKGDVDEAVADFTKAIALNPDLKLASTNRARASRMKDGELAPVIDWLIQEGEAGKIEAHLLKDFNIGVGDISVFKQAHTSDDMMFHFAGVSLDGRNVFVSRQKQDRLTGVLWLTSPAGELRTTGLITNTAVKIVANERYSKGFAFQKRFLLNCSLVTAPDANPSRASD
jgi:tetratricopeptide (TPR) repeat protein